MIGAAVIILTFIVNAAFDNWIDNKALPWLGRAIKAVAMLPISIFGLIAFIAFISFLVIAFVDTSPTVEAVKEWLAKRQKAPEDVTPVPPPQLSPEDYSALNEARVRWRKHGWMAVGPIEKLLRQLCCDLRDTHQFADLLRHPYLELHQASYDLYESVSDESQLPPHKVQWHIKKLFESYMNGVRWIHASQDAFGVDWSSDSYKDWYQQWEAYHQKFCSDLIDLSLGKYAELRGMVEKNSHTRFLSSTPPDAHT